MWIINGVTEHELLTVWGNSRLFVFKALATISVGFFLSLFCSFIAFTYCINHWMALFFQLFNYLCLIGCSLSYGFYQSDGNSFNFPLKLFAKFSGYLSCSKMRAVIDKLNSLFSLDAARATRFAPFSSQFLWYLTRCISNFIVHREHTNFA